MSVIQLVVISIEANDDSYRIRFGKEHCRSGVASPTVRIVVGVVIRMCLTTTRPSYVANNFDTLLIVVLVFLFIGIAALIKNRRNKKAAAASAAITGPSMSYMPSSYDPNAPQYPAPTATNAQGYPFNGYGAGGPIQGPVSIKATFPGRGVFI